MASIPKMLMDEFYEENRKALDVDNFGRASIFNSGESFVNNFLHGKTVEQCLTLTKDSLNSLCCDANTLSKEEIAAVQDALLIIEIYAEQYGVTLG